MLHKDQLKGKLVIHIQWYVYDKRFTHKISIYLGMD
jgi:hypothetical protein